MVTHLSVVLAQLPGKDGVLSWLLPLVFAPSAFAASSSSSVAAAQPMHWPILTGTLAIVMLFFTWWQQARHRQRLEAANQELKESEEEARRAFGALRENQQLLTSILDNISEGIYRNSPDRGLIFANPAYLKMFGYESLEDLRSVPREQLYARPAERPKLLSLIDRDGGYTNQEVEYRRKDGSTFWGLASSMAVHEPESGRVAYHVGAITNITERRKAERAIRELNQDLERRIAERTSELRASEAQFRTLVEHAPEAIVVFDGDTGRFLSGNENALRLYGVTGETLTQLTPADVSPPFQPNGRTSAEMAAEMMQRACDGGTPVFEWMHRDAKGRLIPSEVRLVRLPAEGKRLLRASILDTSERRRREQIQQATYQISEAAHTTEDLDNLYARIHGIITGLMPAGNFYLALRDDRTGLYHYAYHRDEVDAKPAPRRMSSGLNGYVLRTGKALLATRNSMIDPQSEWHLAAGTPSAIWLGVPLAVHGKILGVMAVQDYRDAQAYGEDEKQILVFVAEQIALAIERKRSEQALRESEEKHRALFEASSQGVMLHDEQQILEVNPAAVRILGYASAEEIIGKHPSETSSPIQVNGQTADMLARKHIADCMEKGSTRFEWLSRSPAGKEVPVEVILTRIQMGGRPIIQAVVNDISERKKAEAELRASEERFKLLFDLAPLGMAQVRWDGSFVQVNRAFADMIGYTPEEVRKLTYWEVTPREYEAAELAVLESLRRTGRFSSHVKEYHHRSGHRVPVVLNGMKVKSADGDETLWGIVEDITNRKRAEEELLNALAREKELSALKTNFVSMVSHEFRTPLGVIMSSSQILDDYFEQLDREERRDHLRSIQKHTRRMANLMEEVLLLSRVESGKLNFDPQPLDIHVFAPRLVDEVHSATNQRCAIDLSLDAPIAEAVGDERLLRHILTNLLSNAVKYSPEGARVGFTIQQQGTHVLFTIRDKGIGIAGKDQAWLFNAFHRGSNVGNTPGTGLGLVIVKRCVDLHGGSIIIDSAVGQGTRVEVSLPMFELSETN